MYYSVFFTYYAYNIFKIRLKNSHIICHNGMYCCMLVTGYVNSHWVPFRVLISDNFKSTYCTFHIFLKQNKNEYYDILGQGDFSDNKFSETDFSTPYFPKRVFWHQVCRQTNFWNHIFRQQIFRKTYFPSIKIIIN